MGWLKWKGTPSLLFFLFILGIWQMVITVAQVPLWLLPTPIQIVSALWETRQLIWMHTLTTLVETTVGFTLAVLFSLLTAGAMVLSPWIKILKDNYCTCSYLEIYFSEGQTDYSLQYPP